MSEDGTRFNDASESSGAWITVSEASFEYVVTFEDGHQLARTSEYTARGQTVKDEVAADTIAGTTTDMLFRSTTRKVTRTAN